MVIGVTGGVGTGKSTILSILESDFDARIILADDVCRDLMEPGE
ncbi:MAG: dephospho-CoA kinase, partial [Lachnospiraceae bacterium]|nr:dephospho-CoA kinase [Lachnospiraceae bacterium]